MKIWFQNRRTKWKKQENLSNAEAAEHRACAEHRRSTDHRRRGSAVGGGVVDDASPGRGGGVCHSPPPTIVSHPPAPTCNPLTVALASASPAAAAAAAALQFQRVLVSCSPAAAVTSLAAHHDPAAAFRLPPLPPGTDCRCDAILPPAVTSFRPSPLLPVSRCDDVTPRQETPPSPVALTVDESSAVVARPYRPSCRDSDVVLPANKLVDVENVGSDGSMPETD